MNWNRIQPEQVPCVANYAESVQAGLLRSPYLTADGKAHVAQVVQDGASNERLAHELYFSLVEGFQSRLWEPLSPPQALDFADVAAEQGRLDYIEGFPQLFERYWRTDQAEQQLPYGDIRRRVLRLHCQPEDLNYWRWQLRLTLRISMFRYENFRFENRELFRGLEFYQMQPDGSLLFDFVAPAMIEGAVRMAYYPDPLRWNPKKPFPAAIPEFIYVDGVIPYREAVSLHMAGKRMISVSPNAVSYDGKIKRHPLELVDHDAVDHVRSIAFSGDHDISYFAYCQALLDLEASHAGSYFRGVINKNLWLLGDKGYMGRYDGWELVQKLYRMAAKIKLPEHVRQECFDILDRHFGVAIWGAYLRDCVKARAPELLESAAAMEDARQLGDRVMYAWEEMRRTEEGDFARLQSLQPALCTATGQPITRLKKAR